MGFNIDEFIAACESLKISEYDMAIESGNIFDMKKYISNMKQHISDKRANKAKEREDKKKNEENAKLQALRSKKIRKQVTPSMQSTYEALLKEVWKVVKEAVREAKKKYNLNKFSAEVFEEDYNCTWYEGYKTPFGNATYVVVPNPPQHRCSSLGDKYETYLDEYYDALDFMSKYVEGKCSYASVDTGDGDEGCLYVTINVPLSTGNEGIVSFIKRSREAARKRAALNQMKKPSPEEQKAVKALANPVESTATKLLDTFVSKKLHSNSLNVYDIDVDIDYTRVIVQDEKRYFHMQIIISNPLNVLMDNSYDEGYNHQDESKADAIRKEYYQVYNMIGNEIPKVFPMLRFDNSDRVDSSEGSVIFLVDIATMMSHEHE